MIRLVVTGVAGKMGSTILKLALADPEIRVAGALESKGHPLVGGMTVGSVPVYDDLSTLIGECDGVIDFTEPKASLEHFRTARAHKKAIVIGTTGFAEDALAEIRGADGARARAHLRFHASNRQVGKITVE